MKIKVNILILFFLLLDNLYLPINLGFDFRLTYIVYFIYIIYAFVIKPSVIINKNFMILSALFLIISLLTSLIKGTPTVLVLKQAILIYINFLVSYIVFNSYNFDVIAVIKDYIQLIFIASIVGLIQLFSQNVGFFYGADYSYLGFEMGNYKMMPFTRIQSWFYEPSFLIYAFMPVVFIAVGRLFNLTELISLKKAMIVLLIFILSRSAIGFLGLLITIILIAVYKYSILKSPKIVISVFLFSVILSVITYKIPDIKFRIDDTLKLFFDKNVSGKDIDRINLSTYAFFSNYKVTAEAIKNNPVIGTGLGTYEYNYDMYIDKVIPESNFKKYYRINYNDANSMLFRMLAEIGLLGIFFILFLFFKKRIRHNYEKNQLQIITDYWLISNGIFVLILIRLLRQGHYTMLGFTLFLLMYFYANKKLNERVNKINE